MAKEHRLTTFDNPFDPFEQFTSWFLFDVERAIDDIIFNDFLNIYKKVSREQPATSNMEAEQG